MGSCSYLALVESMDGDELTLETRHERPHRPSSIPASGDRPGTSGACAEAGR